MQGNRTREKARMKKFAFAASAIAVGMGLSGCIAQTGFHWTNAQPKAGDTTKGIIDLKGLTGQNGEPNKAYFYIGIIGDGDGVTPKSFKFDPGNVLNAKGKMVSDDDVGDFADTECGPVSGGSTYRTETPVKTSPVDKVFQATFKVKMDGAGGGFGGFISSGQWFDDGDGTAEDPSASGDTYDCGGLTSTVLNTKGFVVSGP
jgi:hypothetical protein